jgi:hypothetical protein
MRTVVAAALTCTLLAVVVPTAEAAKKPVATWRGGSSTKRVVYVKGVVYTSSSVGSVYMCSFKVKGNPAFDATPKKKDDWCFVFAVPADASTAAAEAGVYGPDRAQDVRLETKSATNVPIGTWGSITVDQFSNGSVSGTVAVDDGYLSVNTKFSGPVTTAN